jgi:cell division topological specificity factor
MLDFFRKLFRPEASGATARERLRLVLLSDHLALAPDIVESLKTDLFAVLSRYVEIDEANCEVTFEHRDRDVAMMANIPIRSMKARPQAPAPPPPPEPPAPSFDPAPMSAAVADPPEAAAGPAEPATPPSKPRRRRRRRATTSIAPAPG